MPIRVTPVVGPSVVREDIIDAIQRHMVSQYDPIPPRRIWQPSPADSVHSPSVMDASQRTAFDRMLYAVVNGVAEGIWKNLYNHMQLDVEGTDASQFPNLTKLELQILESLYIQIGTELDRRKATGESKL